MAYNRPPAVLSRPEDNALTQDMAGVGMNFAVQPNSHAPIEETLIHASSLGMDDGDLRVLSVLTTWLSVHSTYINADRLTRYASAHPSLRVHAYWGAITQWLAKDRRFRRLQKLYQGPALPLLPVGNDFQLTRRGEDERFAGSPLRVPEGALRHHSGDVLSPTVLVKQHPGYHNRVLMGPTWRADIWTILERDPSLSVAEAARRAGSSFGAAWQVAQDFALLRGSMESESHH